MIVMWSTQNNTVNTSIVKYGRFSLNTVFVVVAAAATAAAAAADDDDDDDFVFVAALCILFVTFFKSCCFCVPAGAKKENCSKSSNSILNVFLNGARVAKVPPKWSKMEPLGGTWASLGGA